MKVRKAICLILTALIAISAAPPRSEAASAAEINCAAEATLQITGVRELGNKAAGILLFPSVVTAGLGLAGNMARDSYLFMGDPLGTIT